MQGHRIDMYFADAKFPLLYRPFMWPYSNTLTPQRQAEGFYIKALEQVYIVCVVVCLCFHRNGLCIDTTNLNVD